MKKSLFLLHKLPYIITILIGVFVAPINAFAALNIPDVDVMLDNINSQLPYLWTMVTGFSYLAGYFIVFRAVYHFKSYADMQSPMSGGQRDIKPALISLIIGGLLIYFPSTLSSILTTVFGSSGAYAYPTGNLIDPSFSKMGNTIVAIVQFVGVVAFLKGLLLFHRLGSGQAQQGTFSKGLTHVIGGTLCLNIIATSNIIGSTLGLSW